jgi:hypothetical protein
MPSERASDAVFTSPLSVSPQSPRSGAYRISVPVSEGAQPNGVWEIQVVPSSRTGFRSASLMGPAASQQTPRSLSRTAAGGAPLGASQRTTMRGNTQKTRARINFIMRLAGPGPPAHTVVVRGTHASFRTR